MTNGEGARNENHTGRLHSERFNLKDLLLEIIQHYNEAVAMNRRDDVQLQYQPKDIFLEADKDRLQIVIFNLLNNAFNKKGNITIGSKETKSEQQSGNHVMRVIVRFIPILRKYIGMYRISIKIQSQKQ